MIFAALWSRTKCWPGEYFDFRAIFSNSFHDTFGMNLASLNLAHFFNVEKQEFHEFTNNLRISGKTLEGKEDIKKGFISSP